MYHDVIRVGDAEKLMDCSFVQVSGIKFNLITFAKKWTKPFF